MTGDMQDVRVHVTNRGYAGVVSAHLGAGRPGLLVELLYTPDGPALEVHIAGILLEDEADRLDLLTSVGSALASVKPPIGGSGPLQGHVARVSVHDGRITTWLIRDGHAYPFRDGGGGHLRDRPRRRVETLRRGVRLTGRRSGRVVGRRAPAARRRGAAVMTRLLVWLGVWSRCCHAPTYMPYGWARSYCTECYRRTR